MKDIDIDEEVKKIYEEARVDIDVDPDESKRVISGFSDCKPVIKGEKIDVIEIFESS